MPDTRSSRAAAAVAARLLRLRWLVRAPIWLYRARLGAVFGARLLMLEHTGRVSGRRRHVVLEIVARPAPGHYVVASGFGARAQWFRNVMANPRVRVWVGSRRPRPGTARLLTGQQASAALAGYAADHPHAWRTLRPVFETTLQARIDPDEPSLPFVRLDLDPDVPFGRWRRLRVRQARKTIGLLAALALTAAVLAGCGRSAPPAAPGPNVGQQANDALPVAVRDTTLVTSAGRRLDLAQLAGKVVVISDMMTLCQETCPLDTANVVAAARDAERAGLGNKIVFLSVTIDPARDTLARLTAYRHLYAPAPNDWLTAAGAPGALTAFWKQLGVYIQKAPDTPPAPKDWLTGKPLTYDVTHSDELFFLDQQGHERFLLEGAPHVAPGAPLPPTLRRFMDATGRANLTHPDSQTWTLPQELQVLAWLTGHRIPGGKS
ncbi:nitroreductase family deazaflavin-dependent oxidoreductase [Jatrophihabitans cynanchi]|jgi:protein SCO1/2|uniref:Nitroreductase family deazaflavin-dependent oxidoreductase n=1 Tax=Jatrophihabitans cynanchi TaxID=2944128 RepID=A0ABY7K782_9ACTN|nr:nitroreductase family deazaflavin-dependent oxidoreductase [Jatrophihabitans sp. SB3-54]WAX59159.1 nitroreductase family deazaflavin-dependent oxidoreductase [Jatrophihabitans sp. SB3-54]